MSLSDFVADGLLLPWRGVLLYVPFLPGMKNSAENAPVIPILPKAFGFLLHSSIAH